jgi:polar amino acid transport system substrate-binding protein
MKKLKKLTGVITAILMLGLTVTGCGAPNDSAKSASSNKSTLEVCKEKGVVTIGFANEKPFAYQNENGELTGEAVEIAKTICNNLGIKDMKGELTEFSSLIPGLQAKRFDMITAGMFVTPERAKEVNFASPEYSIGEAVAVVKGNPKNIHSYEDIVANSSITIAVPGGVIEEKYLTAVGVKKEQIQIVNDLSAAISAVQSGRADAVTATDMSIKSAIETSGGNGIEIVKDFKQPVIDGKSVISYGATAFRKNDQDFVDAFNAEFKKLKESGELKKILDKYGFTEPGDITVKDIIG